MLILPLIVLNNETQKKRWIQDWLKHPNKAPLRKSVDWFLYDNGPRHERVKSEYALNAPQHKSFTSSSKANLRFCNFKKS